MPGTLLEYFVPLNPKWREPLRNDLMGMCASPVPDIRLEVPELR
jgi:hypothetical protein